MANPIWLTLEELSPWLLLGATIAGALHALLPANFFRRQFSGRGGVIKAAAIGVPLPLCSCGVIPVALSLKREGATNGATAAFLISTPQTGIDSVLVSAAFLGLPFALLKVASGILIGVACGWLIDASTKAAHRTFVYAEVDDACSRQAVSRVRAGVQHALMILDSLWVWLVMGILASAAITYYLPPGELSGLASLGGTPAMGLALLIGLPLYVCATASVAIAAALVHAGFPTGAALVFLIAGPATNLATIGAIYRTLGRRSLAIYLVTLIAESLACGWAFNWAVAPTSIPAMHHHHETCWWASASAVILPVLLASFAWRDGRRILKRSVGSRPSNFRGTVVDVAVKGMTCNGCVAKLESVLRQEAGASSVDVSLTTSRAVVRGLSEDRVRQVVIEAGFAVGLTDK